TLAFHPDVSEDEVSAVPGDFFMGQVGQTHAAPHIVDTTESGSPVSLNGTDPPFTEAPRKGPSTTA
ncbi:MAG: hypothetical protein ACJAV2_004500, partial [Myxococcota bacterium]